MSRQFRTTIGCRGRLNVAFEPGSDKFLSSRVLFLFFSGLESALCTLLLLLTLLTLGFTRTVRTTPSTPLPWLLLSSALRRDMACAGTCFFCTPTPGRAGWSLERGPVRVDAGVLEAVRDRDGGLRAHYAGRGGQHDLPFPCFLSSRLVPVALLHAAQPFPPACRLWRLLPRRMRWRLSL